MKKVFFLFIISLFFNNVFSQDYRTSLGVRGGTSSGLTLKHFYAADDAVEAILAWRYKGFGMTGLWERHAQVLDVWGLKWYYGGGAHVYSFGTNSNYGHIGEDSAIVLGIDGVLGAEYKIKEIPITVSLDWHPGLNVIGTFYPIGNEIGFSARYIFNH